MLWRIYIIIYKENRFDDRMIADSPAMQHFLYKCVMQFHLQLGILYLLQTDRSWTVIYELSFKIPTLLPIPKSTSYSNDPSFLFSPQNPENPSKWTVVGVITIIPARPWSHLRIPLQLPSPTVTLGPAASHDQTAGKINSRNGETRSAFVSYNLW